MQTNAVRGQLFFKNVTANIVKCYWNGNIIRAPLGIENATIPGYLSSPEENYEVLLLIDLKIGFF
jgi:hypothetical protein